MNENVVCFSHLLHIFANLIEKQTVWTQIRPSADPEGGQGVLTPLENHKLYGFL